VKSRDQAESMALEFKKTKGEDIYKDVIKIPKVADQKQLKAV
jgi:hypothetical protein